MSAGDYISATHETNASVPTSDATVLLRSGGVYPHHNPCDLVIETQPMLGSTVVTGLAVTASSYSEVVPSPSPHPPISLPLCQTHKHIWAPNFHKTPCGFVSPSAPLPHLGVYLCLCPLLLPIHPFSFFAYLWVWVTPRAWGSVSVGLGGGGGNEPFGGEGGGLARGLYRPPQPPLESPPTQVQPSGARRLDYATPRQRAGERN